MRNFSPNRRLFLAVMAGAFAGLTEPLRGQENSERMTLRQRISKDLQAWDAILDHRTGTDGDNATAGWLADEICKVRLTPIVDAFSFRRRVLHDCWVTVGDTKIPGVPLFDGGITDSEPMRGKLGRPGEAGTIALVRYSPSPSADSTKAMLALRRTSDHQAIVAVAEGSAVEPGLALLNADDYTQPYGPPVLQVATEHVASLDQAFADRKDVSFAAHVTIEQTRASNIQVAIPGSDESLAPLVIMTPRSAWWTCTSERGGGITVWLECVRYFAKHPPARTVIFTANTGHELGHVGLDRYLEVNRSLIKGASAWIHLGANFAAKDGTLLLQASSEQLMSLLTGELKKESRTADRLTPVQERPLGEARNVYDGGGQYVSILGGNPLFHHPDDRWPDAIDMARTESLARGMLQVAIQMSR